MVPRHPIMLSFACVLFFSPKAVSQDPFTLYPENYRLLLENDRARVIDFQLKKGAREDFHFHPSHVAYILSGFKIQFTFPDGTTRIREAKAGDVLFSEAVTHSPLNIGDTDAHGILIEMKEHAKAGSTEEGVDAEVITQGDLLTAVTFIKGLEGKEEELKRELLALTGPTRAEPGNITYDLYQSPSKKNEFMRFEDWRNLEALEIHKRTPHLQASFQRRQEQGWKTEITLWERVHEQIEAK